MTARRPHLTTVGAIVTEMARQYRRADVGRLDWQDAAHASRILREIRNALEAGENERRLLEVEAAVAEIRGTEPPNRPNGRSRFTVTGRHARP